MHCLVAVSVNAPHLVLVVRFPIPDLRSDQERGPWFKKSLQKEVLRLELEDLELKTEFSGNSSPEQTKIELTFKELSGTTSEMRKHNLAKCTFSTTVYSTTSYVTILIFLKMRDFFFCMTSYILKKNKHRCRYARSV